MDTENNKSPKQEHKKNSEKYVGNVQSDSLEYSSDRPHRKRDKAAKAAQLFTEAAQLFTEAKQNLKDAELINAIYKEQSDEEIKEEIRKCIDEGANINAQSEGNNNSTILHVAVEEDNKYVIEFLLQRNAQINIKNNEGKTPLDLAKDENNHKVISIFEEHLQKHSDSERVDLQQQTTKKLQSSGGSSSEAKAKSKRGSEEGKLYEKISLALLAERGYKLSKGANGEYQDFAIGREVDIGEEGKFDDTVFRYIDQNNRKTLVFVQIKYKQDDCLIDSDSLSAELSKAKGGSGGGLRRDFNLQKYFISYLKARENLKVTKRKELEGGKIKYVAIFTNIGLNIEELSNKGFSWKKAPEDIITLFTVGEPRTQQSKHYYQLSKISDQLQKTLEKSSDLHRVAKELAKYVVWKRYREEKNMGIDEAPMKHYHIALVKEVINKITTERHGEAYCEGRFKDDFIDNNEVGSKQELRDAILEAVRELDEAKRNDSDDTLKDVLRKAKWKLVSDFGKTKKNPNATLPSKWSVVEKVDVTDFLNCLVFMVNQPRVEELERLISSSTQQTVLVETPFKQVLSKIECIGSEIRERIEEVLGIREKTNFKETWISGEKIAKFVQEQKQQISASVLVTAMTIIHEGELMQYGKFNRLEGLSEILDNFLQDKNKNVLCVCTPETLLSSIKVLQHFSAKEGYRAVDGRISVSLEVLKSEELRDSVAKTFESSSSNLLIIESNLTLQGQYVLELYNKLSLIIKDNSSKKIILITQNNNDNILAERLRTDLQLGLFAEENDEISLKDFEPKENLFVKKVITFQGQKEKTCLARLIGSANWSEYLKNFQGTGNEREIIDVKTLVKLLNNEEIKIGKELDSLDRISDYYISRNFYRLKITKKIQQKKQFKGRLCYNRNDFERLRQKYPRGNIHLIHSKKKLIWQCSQGSALELRKYVKLDKNSNAYYSEADLLNLVHQQKVVIIANTAGMGKSTVLSNVAQTLKNKFPHEWVIRINLNDCNDVLLEELNSRKKQSPSFSPTDSNNTIGFLLKLLNSNEQTELKTSLEQMLFRTALNSENQITILIDGFDEIQEYKDVAMDMLLGLKRTKIKSIWVTTRPSMQRYLEQKLKTLSYKLRPFSRIKDQKEFLTEFWKKRFNENSAQNDEKRFKAYVEEIVQLLSGLSKGDEEEFISIPLHIMMVGEIFYENTEKNGKWQGCKEFVSGNDINPSLLIDEISVVDIYEQFVRKKFYDFYHKEKKVTHIAKSGASKRLDEEYKQFKEDHEKLALYVMLKDKDNDLFTRELQKIKGFLQQVKDGKTSCTATDIGIIDQIADDKLHFTHHNFAEYLASVSIADKFPKDVALTLDCINCISSNASPIFIHSVIGKLNDKKEAIFELLEEKPLLNFVTIKGHSNSVKALLEEGYMDWPNPDPLGKTPLHYAAEYVHLNIVEYLLDYNNDILEENILQHGSFKKQEYENSKLVEFVNKKDKSDKTALTYSVQSGNTDIALKLILKGASLYSLDKSYIHKLIRDMLHGYKLSEGSFNPGVLDVSMYEDHKYRPIQEKLLLEAPDIFKGLSEKHKSRLLSYFFKHGRVKVIKALLESINDAEVKRTILNNDDNGFTPLDSVNHSDVLTDEQRLEVTEYIMENGGVTTNHNVGLSKDDDLVYTKVLQAAVENGHVKTFKYFITRGSKSYFIHLYLACRNNQHDIVNYLLSNYKEEVKNEETAVLHAAIYSSASLKIIKCLIERGENVNSKDNKGRTPLFMTRFTYSELNIIKYLVKHGADVNIPDKRGNTFLYYAIQNDQADLVLYLLESGATVSDNSSKLIKNKLNFYRNPCKFNLNFSQENKLPRLHAAIKYNNLEWGKFIIRKGGDINLKDGKGRTPLHLAVIRNNYQLVESLLQYGAAHDFKDNKGNTPIDLARRIGYNIEGNKIIWLLETLDLLFNGDSLMKSLRKYFCAPQQKNKNWGPYESGIDDWSKNALINLILNAHNSEGKTLFHIALSQSAEQNSAIYDLIHLKCGPLKVNRMFLRLKDYHPIPINSKDTNGDTPLHLAAEQGFKQLVCVLLERGAIFNAQNKQGYTPQKLAEMAQKNHMVEFLGLMQSLFDAVEKGNLQKVQNFKHQLLKLSEKDFKKKSDLFVRKRIFNAIDKSGKTLLHLAVSSNNCGIRIIESLLKEDIDVNSLNADNCTPLHIAATKSNFNLVKYLLQKGAFYNVRNENGFTPKDCTNDKKISLLFESVERMFDSLHSDNPDVTISDLQDISDSQNTQVIINAKDRHGNAVLHYAAEYGYFNIVKNLLQIGVIYNIRDNFGATATNHAKNHKISSLLKSIDEMFEDTKNIFNTEQEVDMQIIINARNDEGITLLQKAGKERNWAAVKKLIQYDASFNPNSDVGKELLRAAKETNQQEIIDLLNY